MFKNPIKTFATFLLLAALGAHAQDFPTAGANPRVVMTNVPNTSFGHMGLGFLSDGRMVLLSNGTTALSAQADLGGGDIQTWSSTRDFSVWIVSGLSAKGNLSNVTATKILDQLTGPPPGIVVVNDTVYVMDRTAFYRINSLNPTGGTSKAQNATRLIDVPSLDSNFSWNRGPSGHQWMFTPQYHNGRFYANYSGSIRRPAASGAPPTNTLTGAVLSWARDTVVAPNVETASPNNNRGYRREAGGLRSPNGLGTNGAYMLNADNQGSFNPGNAVRLYKPGQPLMTYSHRQCTAENLGGTTAADCNLTQTNNIAAANTVRGWAEDLPYMPPVIWIPFSPFRSISQPHYMNHGPYKGQWLLGDVNGHGVGRLLVEDVDNLGHYQASFTLFSGGALNSFGITGTGNRANRAINRWATSPDSAIYVGSIYRRDGNWSAGETAPLLRLTFKDTSVFEILAMRSRKSADGTVNGVEIEFTEPVDPATINAAAFSLMQYNYGMGAVYGTNATVYSTKTPTVHSVAVSNDGRRVFMGINTPDTSIGASHFGVYGVGNNTRGVWVGAGDQDRTLRVTLGTGVRSAAGASLFYNIAWLGWHFQSTQNYSATTASINPALRAEVDRLAAAVSARVTGGILDIQVGLPGETRVAVYSLTGELKAKQASASGTFQFNTRTFDRGVHVLRIQQGDAVIARRINL
ncbi:MAG: hypothetical protein K0Q91_1581 [Fibrobacteria bacterium]|nr:hypothetical protein [Fibrobacteria bacterium]